MGEHVIEHRSSRAGRWLKERRVKIVLLIGVAEGIIVAVTPHVSRWMVIAAAIPLIVLYMYAGRKADSDTFRQITWILATSQALAVVTVILAFILFWTALLLVALFAVIALFLLITERPK